MKLFFVVAFAVFIITTSATCNKKADGNICYKGRLEIKALCMNYTIKLLDGDMNPSLIEKAWSDESTGKAYTNVFALGSPCSFPANISEGDEFYFKIDSSDQQNCAVCLAYYPKPGRQLSIKVLTAACN